MMEICYSLPQLLLSHLQIYIVRANRLSETDGALGLMHLSHAKRTDFGKQRASRSARMLPLSLKNACKNRYLLVFRLSSVLSSESFKQFKQRTNRWKFCSCFLLNFSNDHAGQNVPEAFSDGSSPID
jgi:hypothetical protein